MRIVLTEKAFVMKIILLIKDSRRQAMLRSKCRENFLLVIPSKILQGSFKTIRLGTVAVQCRTCRPTYVKC